MAQSHGHTDDEILDVVSTVKGRQEQADALGITIRGLLKRLKDMREAGKFNLDENLPIYPGAGRQITSVTTLTDAEGNPRGYHVKEKQVTGEHVDVIDAPIVRQSRLTGRSGEVLAQWDIRVPEKQHDAMKAAFEEMKAEIVPLPPRAVIEEPRSEELANEYIFSDSHLGCMADAENEESLQDQFDLICKCFEHMIKSSPKAKTAILTILGDWFHFDNLLPLTPRSGNVLFANGNYRMMVKMGVRLMRKLIDWCLMNHDEVIVVICEGNHDQASAMWLRTMMQELYKEEPRIKIADNDIPFFAIPFGTTFLGYHHGHIKTLKDPKDLALYFAAEFRKIWGDTKHTFLKTGHLHHIHEKEEHGVMIQQVPTLASKDSHSRQNGYRSVEATYCTTYSKQYGEVGSVRITKDMLR